MLDRSFAIVLTVCLGNSNDACFEVVQGDFDLVILRLFLHCRFQR